MKRDIQIHVESVATLYGELSHVVEYFQNLGHGECDLLFGFAWRSEECRTELSWKRCRVSMSQLWPEIRKAEEAELGRFTGDDVFLYFNNIDCEFQFCHHSGVHMFFSKAGPITEHFLNRWLKMGLEPQEWQQDLDGKTWHRAPDGLA